MTTKSRTGVPALDQTISQLENNTSAFWDGANVGTNDDAGIYLLVIQPPRHYVRPDLPSFRLRNGQIAVIVKVGKDDWSDIPGSMCKWIEGRDIDVQAGSVAVHGGDPATFKQVADYFAAADAAAKKAREDCRATWKDAGLPDPTEPAELYTMDVPRWGEDKAAEIFGDAYADGRVDFIWQGLVDPVKQYPCGSVPYTSDLPPILDGDKAFAKWDKWEAAERKRRKKVQQEREKQEQREREERERIEAKERAAQEIEDRKARLAAMDAEQDEIPETEPAIIDGWTYYEDDVSVTVGAEDTGKTTLVVDEMVHIAYGLDFQGHPTTMCPVLYIATEGHKGVNKRIAATRHVLKNGKGSTFGEGRPPIRVIDRLPKDDDDLRQLVSDYAEERFQQALDMRAEGLWPNAVDPDDWASSIIVVVDTVRGALDGDERGKGMADFIRRMVRLKNDHSDIAHIALLHHTVKSGEVYAGAGDIVSNTDVLRYVRRAKAPGDGEDRTPLFTVVPKRLKDIELPKPKRLRINTVTLPGMPQTVVLGKAGDTGQEVSKLGPVLDALRELDDPDHITDNELNACLDVVAVTKSGAPMKNPRKMRPTTRAALVEAEIIEPVEDDDTGRVEFYRFHDDDE